MLGGNTSKISKRHSDIGSLTGAFSIFGEGKAMPRNGSGVYSKPVGTTAQPNTPIESQKYNSTIDDLVADANNARPVVAGGTGSQSPSGALSNLGGQPLDAGLTSISGLTTAANQMIYTTAADVYATTALTPFARTILDDADAATARATLGANNASNLNAGTVADALLPSSMSAKTFTGGVFAKSQMYIDNAGDRVLSFRNAAGDVQSAQIISSPGSAYSLFLRAFNAAGTAFKDLVLSQSGSIVWGNDTVWTAGNDGAGTGLDADTVDGIQGASLVQTSRNIIAGNGLTGGGALSADRTLTLGTPGSISGSSTNSVSATSHTHDFSLSSSDVTGYLGFTPIQQNGGASMGSNKVIIGWGSSIARLHLQVDSTSFAYNWPIDISGTAAAATSANNSNNLGGVAAANFAQFSYSGNQSETSFPMGQTLGVLTSGVTQGRREYRAVYLHSTNTAYYTLSTSAGAQLTGMWRQTGQLASDTANYQRVA